MATKKDIIIAVLATFCLASALFMIVPSKSSPYDAWKDIDGNGIIDMKDIGYTIQSFGTSGDSTKNVNVTNWPQPKLEYEIIHLEFNLTEPGVFIPWTYCGGYSRMGIMTDWTDRSEGTYDFTVSIISMFWGDGIYDSESMESLNFSNTAHIYPGGAEGHVSDALLLETKGPHFQFAISVSSTQPGSWMIWHFAIYLRNE